MKRILLVAVLLVTFLNGLVAREGMWVPILLEIGRAHV